MVLEALPEPGGVGDQPAVLLDLILMIKSVIADETKPPD